MEKWKFNNQDLCTNEWNVEGVVDGLGFVGFKGQDLEIPAKNGNTWIRKLYNSRSLILSCWVRGGDRSQLDKNIDELTKIFGVSGLHTLQRIMRDGTIRQAQAEIYNAVYFIPKRNCYSKFSLEFSLPDPFFYGTTKETDLITSVGLDNYWIHSNSGSAPVYNAVITLSGPLEMPKLINIDRNIWIQYQGTIETGQTVTINTKDFTCLKDGVNMISAVKHSGDYTWMILDSGNTQMQLTTQFTGGSVKIEYYPSYF